MKQFESNKLLLFFSLTSICCPFLHFSFSSHSSSRSPLGSRCNNGAHSSLRAQVANLSRYSRIIRKIKYFFITSHGDLCRVSSCCSLRWGFLFIKCKFSSFSSLLFAHEWAFPTPLQLSFVFLYVSSRKRSRGLICKWKKWELSCTAGRKVGKIYAKKPFFLDLLQIVKDLSLARRILHGLRTLTLHFLFFVARYFARWHDKRFSSFATKKQCSRTCFMFSIVCIQDEREVSWEDSWKNDASSPPSAIHPHTVYARGSLRGFSFQLWGFSMFVFNFYVILCEKERSREAFLYPWHEKAPLRRNWNEKQDKPQRYYFLVKLYALSLT